jgi:hypothetical protein
MMSLDHNCQEGVIKFRIMDPHESSTLIVIIFRLRIGHRVADLEGVECFSSKQKQTLASKFVVNRLHNTIVGQIDIARTQCAVQPRKQHVLNASNSMESYLNSMSGGHDESV